MKLPSKLRIGYQTYSLVDSTEVLTELNYQGRTDKNQALIEFSNRYPDEEIADTLIHEVLHAIFYNYIYDLEGMDEEAIVTMVAHGLSQVFKDNPKFIDEVQKLLKDS